MPVFDFEGINGLTARDRELWEKQNIDKLKGTGYESWSEGDKIRAFRDATLKHRFGDREDFSRIKSLNDDLKDSIFDGTLDVAKALEKQDEENEKASKTHIDYKKRREYELKNMMSPEERKEAEEAQEMREAINSTYSPNKTSEGEAHSYYEDLDVKLREMQASDKAFDEAYQIWDRKHQMSYQGMKRDVDNIKDIASRNSPYYKKYNGTDYLKLSDDDWMELTTTYQALLDSKGEKAANDYLDGALAVNVSKNMPSLEKLWRGFQGIGASAAGAIVSGVGMLYGVGRYISGAYEDVEGLNGVQNFINSALDNSVTRYGNDIVKYGAFLPASMERAKETGISDIAIESAASNGFLGETAELIGEGLASQGFTLASMLAGWGLAKGAGWIIGNIGKALISGKTGEALMATRNALQTLQKVENGLNKYVIPATLGTMEGAVEGLNTKEDVQEEALEQLDALHENKIGEEAKIIIARDYIPVMNKDAEGVGTVTYKNKKTGEVKTAQEIYQSVWDSHMDEYNESLKQIDYASSAAGVDNFIFNSFINGIANSTLKATQLGERTKKALAESKVFKPFQRFTNEFRVTGEGAGITVTPRMAKSKMILNLFREPVGQAIEEYEQNISNEVASSAALNNIETFINAKYNGDMRVEVGDTFASDWAAALEGFTDNLVSESSLRSAMMGALGSVLGLPTLNFHAVFNGYRTDSDGNVEYDEDGKPEEKRTWLGRGIKANGERETWFDWAARLTPWRSPIVNAYREAKTERESMEARAQHLQEWLRKPENRAKWDGVAGSWSWAERMQKAADANDEFDYRNSHLGKMINDAFMLRDIEGSTVYNAQMEQLNEVANLEDGTDAANSYVQAMRDNVNIDTDGMTDEEILARLKKNANSMLQTLDDIETASQEIESTFGQVDEDAKQALIYNRLAEKDWAAREKELKEKVSQLQVEDSESPKSKNSDLNKEQKGLLARYGSLAKAREAVDNDKKKLAKLEEDIKNLKDKKNRSKSQESTLEQKQEYVKSLKEKIQREDDILKSLPKISYEETQADGTTTLKEREMTDNDLVLNEQEIMAMGVKERAQFLLRGAANRYNVVHGNESTNERSPYSAEQQAVIDNLVNQIGDQGLADLVDLGRIQDARERGAQVYAKIATDRTGLYQYIDLQKKAAARYLTQQKYAHLGDMTDYGQFRDEMDNLFKNGTMQERMVVTNMLRKSGNALWERYSKQRQTVEDISRQLDANGLTKDLSLNDMQLMDVMSEYLVRNDIDMTDENAVMSALGAINDATGNSAITDYVHQYNKGREKPITLDNIAEVVGRYKEAIKQMNANRDARDRITRPAPESTGQSKPKPQNNIFDRASTDPNSGSGPTDAEVEGRETTAPGNDNATTPGERVASGQQENERQSQGEQSQERQSQERQSQGEQSQERQSQGEQSQERQSQGEQSQERQSQERQSQERQSQREQSQERQSQGEQSQEEETSREEAPGPEFSPENRMRQTEEYAKTHKAEVLKRLHDKIAKSTSRLTRFSSNKTNTRLQQYEDFIGSMDTENMSEEDIFNAIEHELQNNKGWDNILKANIQTALNAVRSDMDTIGNAVDTQIRESQAQEAEGGQVSRTENVTDDTTTREIETIDPEEAMPGSALARLFAKAGTKRYINNGLLRWKRKTRKGKLQVEATENPKVRFLYDPKLARQVQGEIGNSYSDDATPIVMVYPLAQEEYKDYPDALDINGKKYMPVGVLPANNNTKRNGVETAKLIRDNIGDRTQRHFIKSGDKYIESTPRVRSPRLESSNSSKHDRDVRDDTNTIGNNAIEEAEREAKDNNQQLSQEEKDKIGSRAVRDFINKLHKRLAVVERTVNGKKFSELSYQLPTLKGDGSVTNHLFREKSLGELTNQDGKSIMDLYNSGQSLKDFNQFFTDFAAHLEEKIANTISNGSLASIDNVALTAMLRRDIYSAHEEYSIKVNDTEGYSLYLGDTELADIMLDADNKLIIDYQKLFNNLIVPGGSLRKNLNMQLDYKSMVKDDNKGHYLFNRAVYAGVLRNGISDPNWERSNRTVTCEIPEGLGKPVPVRRETRVVNDDSDNTNGRNDDNVITPSGKMVDTQTGTDDHGRVPDNPVTDLRKQAMKIADRIVADTKNIHLTADERNYEGEDHVQYERVTSFISDEMQEFSKLWETPSTNIGTTVDNFVRDFFELANADNNILTEEKLDMLFSEHEDTDGKTYLKNSTNNRVYYNVTQSQMRAFASQVIQLQKYFRDNGLTVIPKDVTVTGTVVDAKGSHNIAGTLDILAIDRDGNFHIFDMKTHRWEYDKPSHANSDVTELEDHKVKWGKQLSLYKKFLEDKYLRGTPHRVVECAIIPIKVDYATPTESKPYTSVDERDNVPMDQRTNKLEYDGIGYSGASISLDLNGERDGGGIHSFEPVNVRGDFYVNPEKAVEGTINPATSQRKSRLDTKNQYQGSSRVDAGQEAQGETKAWMALTPEQRKDLKEKWHISNSKEARQKWNTMSAEQQERELECCG